MVDVPVCRNSSMPGCCRGVDGICPGADPALNWGTDISEALLATVEAAVERGRVEIDRSYSNRSKVDLGLHQITFLQPGSMLTVQDIGNDFNGLLRSINITVSKEGGSFKMESTVEVETDEII